MKRPVTIGLLLGLVCLGLYVMGAPVADEPAAVPPTESLPEEEPMLAHVVYYSLNDKSEESKNAILDDLHKYFAPLPGMKYFVAGVVSDVERDIVDRDYELVAVMIFKNKNAMLGFRTHPNHEEFAAKHKDDWEKIRVFDSSVTGGVPEK
jgi:hypothetical protein